MVHICSQLNQHMSLTERCRIKNVFAILICHHLHIFFKPRDLQRTLYQLPVLLAWCDWDIWKSYTKHAKLSIIVPKIISLKIYNDEFSTQNCGYLRFMISKNVSSVYWQSLTMIKIYIKNWGFRSDLYITWYILLYI